MSDDIRIDLKKAIDDAHSSEVESTCIICGLGFNTYPNEARQICRECAGRIKYMIYPKGEMW